MCIYIGKELRDADGKQYLAERKEEIQALLASKGPEEREAITLAADNTLKTYAAKKTTALQKYSDKLTAKGSISFSLSLFLSFFYLSP